MVTAAGFVAGQIVATYRVPASTRYSDRLATFERETLPRCADVVLVGSSSIKRWDIKAAFPDHVAINRGLEAAEVADVRSLLPRLVQGVRSKAVLLYIGENDVARGRNPQSVSSETLSLIRDLHRALPRTSIYYLSIKPTPHRWRAWPRSQLVNAIVRANAGRGAFDYIEIGQKMAPTHAPPDAMLFRADGIHMTDAGYAIWSSAIAPIMNRLGTNTRPGC